MIRPRRGSWLLVTVMLVSGCSGYNPPKSVRRGGTLVVAVAQDPRTLNPLVAGDVWSVRALTPLFPNLYEVHSDLSVAPDLAEALPAISSDGLTWTVRLRTARWSDGQPITADDVVFTVQSEMSSELDTERRFDWSVVSAVNALDAHTVRFQLKRPDGALLGNQLVMPLLPHHALANVALKEMSTARFSTQPQVGGGPFVLSLRVPGQALDLVANRRYHGPSPHLDGVQVKVVDPATLPDQMGQGYVNWAPDISPQTAARLKGLPNITVSSFPQLGSYSLVFNCRAGRAFAAREVRVAAASAIDHRRVAAAALGSPVWNGTQAGSWAHSTAAAPAPVAAGDPTLAPLRTATASLIYPLGDAARAAAATELSRELAASGATVTAQGLPPGIYQDRLAAGDFDMALAGLGEGVDPDPALTAASWETPAQAVGGQNYGAYSDPGVDALVQKDLALDPTDHSSRLATLDLLAGALRDDPPYVDLWTVDELDAFSQSVVGVGTAGIQLDHDLQSSFYARWSLSA